MNNCNNHCESSCNNPCDNECNRCHHPAQYGCDFSIAANPYDKSIWNVTICGATTRVKIPKINETCTSLSVNGSSDSLIYSGECSTTSISGDQLGSIIDLGDLQDVDAVTPDSCDMLVFDPGCTDCGDGCKPKPAMWRNYHIPDAGDCEMDTDENGFYHVLKKNDCGCVVECKLPVVPDGMISLDYIRDSVPDDPDFPWYYGNYNDTINLHLADNASAFFGKYDLEVTVNYGVQAILSSQCKNVNFRSILVPVIADSAIDISHKASILQSFSMAAATPEIPWGTTSLRGSFTFVVPKGKEAYLHHEYRLRTLSSFPNYYTSPKDGQRVPDSEIGLNTITHNASRLNALQVIIRPTRGTSTTSPVADAIRDQLDAPVDEYPNPY